MEWSDELSSVVTQYLARFFCGVLHAAVRDERHPGAEEHWQQAGRLHPQGSCQAGVSLVVYLVAVFKLSCRCWHWFCIALH